ncbi:MAG: oligosaccharide flippase family protein [Candidatus Eisenbacteria bacterium]
MAASIGLVLFLVFIDRVVSFARGIVFARLLGTTEYGIYTLGLFLVPLLGMIASLGVPSAFMRYAPRYAMRGGLRSYLRKTYVLTIALSVLLTAVVLVRPSFFSRLIYGNASHTDVIIVSAMGIPAFLLLRNLTSTFMGLKLFRAGRLAESGQVAIYAVAGIALVVVSRSAAMGILGFVISAFGAVVIFLPLLLRYARSVEPVPEAIVETAFYRRLLRFTVWFAVTPILAQIFQYVDRFSLQHLMNTSDQGIYSATVNLSESMSAVGLAICNVVYPHLSATWEMGQREKALKDLDGALRVTAIILLVIGLVLVVLGKWFITVVLGADYAPGARVLPFLVVFYLYTTLVWLFGVYPPLIEKTYVSAIAFSIAMPATIILNLLLIPRLGMVGAAVATMVSYFLMWCIVVALCHRFGLPVTKRTVVTCLLAFVLLMPPLLAVPIVGLIVYICIRKTWIISVEERDKVYGEARRILVRARQLVARSDSARSG